MRVDGLRVHMRVHIHAVLCESAAGAPKGGGRDVMAMAPWVCVCMHFFRGATGAANYSKVHMGMEL